MKRYCLQTAAWLLSLLLAFVPICFAEGNTDLYREDFESKTMDGWVSYEDKSGIVETEDGYAYCVRSYDYNSKTSSFSDYDFSLRMKVDYKDGSAAPAFYLRRGADGNRYEVYIDSAAGKMVVDRVVNEEKTLIGEVAADFAADNNQWVSVRFVLSGKNIWIYYRDLEQPAAQLRKPRPRGRKRWPTGHTARRLAAVRRPDGRVPPMAWRGNTAPRRAGKGRCGSRPCR